MLGTRRVPRATHDDDDLDAAWNAVHDAMPAVRGHGVRLTAVAVLSMLAMLGSLAGCIPRHPADLATGECVEVGFGHQWNEVTVVPCSLLGREHVYRVAEVMFGDVAHGEGTRGCPPGVGYEMFSLGTRIEGVVMPGPARLFCLFE